MRRHVVRPAVAASVVAVGLLCAAAPLAAQTTPTTPTTLTPPTTASPVTPTTTPPPTVAPPTTSGGATASTSPLPPATTTQATTDDDSGTDIPWIPIAIGGVVLVLLVVVIVLLARRRGAARQRIADWRIDAADATAEAGATARLLSQGTPPSGQIAKQLLASLRAFEDLRNSAPDDSLAETAEQARRAVQMLGLAIDSDYRLRRSQSADPRELAQSQQAVQTAAADADRTLRGVYRTFTGTH